MKIELLDLRRQYRSIKDDIDAAIARVVESGQFIGGSEVTKLEEEIASYIGTKYAVAVASGTDALMLALMALNIKQGDEVITTSFSFVATAETIAILGAVPVFVDIDPSTYCIDPASIEKAITKKTKVIIPVHLYGQTAVWDEIEDIARKHDLKVIEDGAQAIGAEYKGRKACSLGEIGCLSFFPSKNLGAYGDGGMVTTNEPDLARKVKTLSQHGAETKYMHKLIGVNSRLDAIQASILRAKLSYIDKWNRKRREIAEFYNKSLQNSDAIIPFCPKWNLHVYHQYSIRVKERDRFQVRLKERNIPTAVHYPLPLHLQEAFTYLDYHRGDLPISEQIANEIVSLPIYPELTEEEMEYIVGGIIEALQ